MGIILAGVWSLAEATLFFLVPDIWLSRLAITHTRTYALTAALAAALAALLGGALLVLWSLLDSHTAYAWVESVPAVSAEMMQRVAAQLESEGAASLFVGSFSGVPYKTYAVQVQASGVALTWFLLASLPARLSRFVLVVLLSDWCARRLSRRFDLRALLHLWALLWLVFYTLYFSLTPG